MDIKFKEGRENNLVTLTAYIGERELIVQGRQYAQHIVGQLVKQALISKYAEIESLVVDEVLSERTKNYVISQIREIATARVHDFVDDMLKERKS